MRYYIEAYGKDGKQILGNGDGQATFVCKNHMPWKNKAWKRLIDTTLAKISPKYDYVSYRLVNENNILIDCLVKVKSVVQMRELTYLTNRVIEYNGESNAIQKPNAKS